MEILFLPMALLIGFWVWARHETIKRRGGPRIITARRRWAQAEGSIVAYCHDRDTARRLLIATHHKYPGRSLEWCRDKTINDLLRDRQ